MEKKQASKNPYYKVVVLGSSLAVGKTSLVERFVNDRFSVDTCPTIGVDYFLKIVNFPQSAFTIKLHVWDTCGQEDVRPNFRDFLPTTKAFLVVYDVTNRQTFEDTVKYIEDARKICGNQVPIVLVGNKVDLPSASRNVSEEDGQTKATELAVKFIETSAKSGFNVNKAFEIAASSIQPMLPSFPSRTPADPITQGSCRVVLVLREDPPLSVFVERVNLHLANGMQFLMFDTKSGRTYRKGAEMYLEEASAVMIIYDTTKSSSFKHAAKIINQIQAKYGPILPTLFLGRRPCMAYNRNQNRKVSESEGLTKARKHGVFFMEVSGGYDLWVTEAFTLLESVSKKKPQCRHL